MRPGPPGRRSTTSLTARWGLTSTCCGGRTARAPVDHPAWPLHRAGLLAPDDDLVATAGLRVEGTPHVPWSHGVPVQVGRPELLPR